MRVRDHTMCPKRFRTRRQNNIGVSRAELFAGDHRARPQHYPIPLLQCLSTPDRQTSTSHSQAKPEVTWVELGNLPPILGVLPVTEARREEVLGVAKVLVGPQFAGTIGEDLGLEHDRMIPDLLVCRLF